MLSYKAEYGQSIYDVCLQTYGSLDFLLKLVLDNNLNSINVSGIAGIVFIFDESIISDRLVFDINNANRIRYVTEV